MKTLIKSFKNWLLKDFPVKGKSNKVFLVGERVFRTSPPCMRGFHTVTSERIWVDEKFFWGETKGFYYILDNSEKISAWDYQLEKVK